ncbi:MAG TPA: cyclic nucleotide-binding domain-containing protein [Longimicrobiaceae bacterium]|nr:cyclic nucleotide-binding domain-containing protein [Longimicrobiaceae bacterium]
MNKVPPPFMGDFSDEDLRWVQANGIQRSVPAGEAIIREGEPLEELFVILRGSFRVASDRLAVPAGEPLGVGEIAGEVSYLSNRLPLATVTAQVDSVVLCIARRKLDRKIAEDAGFAARFRKVVSEFAADRATAAPVSEDELGNLRVYELIEKMLGGEFPPGPPPSSPPPRRRDPG